MRQNPGMKAVRFDFADADFPASLVEVDDPVLPTGEWARVEVGIGGICGSDLHLFAPLVGGSPTLRGIADFPFELGHEIAGTVIEAGRDCPFAVGTRVAVDPIIPCLPRGIDPPCANCARGWASSCLHFDSHVMTGGRALGYTRGLGAGWAEQVLGHRSMLHPIPDGVPDRAAALHEPISIAMHGLAHRPPDERVPVLVVGGGIIGLTALLAVRAYFPDNPVTVLVRYPHQAEAARACGATTVVMGSGAAAFEELAALTGGRSVGHRDDRMLLGGFPYVIEAAGSPSAVTDALRAADHRGTVLTLGAAAIGTVDLTPIWYKQLVMVGSVDHGSNPSSVIGQAPAGLDHSIDAALAVLARRAFPAETLVTHEFPLESYREAVQAGLDKGTSRAMKVVFRPNG
jgi:threonine dehydrogenase-like Zn-dependent dehydrogenase